VTTGRRHRLGPGSSSGGWSPWLQSSTRDEDRFWREREIEQLERALAESGEVRRRELAQLVGARYWGPGRFIGALREAVREGRIARPAFGRYAPVETAASASDTAASASTDHPSS
jgi:hypothetical protein